MKNKELVPKIMSSTELQELLLFNYTQSKDVEMSLTTVASEIARLSLNKKSGIQVF